MFKKAATELLSLKRDDVQSVLLASLHGKNEDIVQILRTIPYFGGWSQDSLKRCCILANIKRYLPETVIADYNDMNHGYTYFVIDGVCSVVQKITLKIETGFRGRKLFAISANQVRGTTPNQNVVFVKIRFFKNGDCFGLGSFPLILCANVEDLCCLGQTRKLKTGSQVGAGREKVNYTTYVGEDLTNRWIISDSAVRCLVIPRDFLLQHNQNNIWPRLLQKITASFPSNECIHTSLKQQVEWYRYKKELIEHSRRHKYFNNTTLNCVPYHWLICVDVPKSLL